MPDDVLHALTYRLRGPMLRCLQENERLAAEMEAMRASPSPLEEARAKHQEHLSDRDKFRKLLDNLQVGVP